MPNHKGGIGPLKHRSAYSYKRLRHGWAVYHVATGQFVLTRIPSRIQAMYVAATHMDRVHDYFFFGDALKNEE